MSLQEGVHELGFIAWHYVRSDPQPCPMWYIKNISVKILPHATTEQVTQQSHIPVQGVRSPIMP